MGNAPNQIEHKDGAAVNESFTYTLSNMGNISRTTEADGTYWDYRYDAAYRLTTADRKSFGGNVWARYRYYYDAAANVVTTVEPFEDIVASIIAARRSPQRNIVSPHVVYDESPAFAAESARGAPDMR